ncbi:hypothetical protein [Chryseobacterium sp. JUb7]|uniref:hypothetical protein n=1 Tax=Chryseobacterium sp. JUb7 TaxID=2940599 RepID=UPI002167ED76|nr:hypothetical protein [Chryseobacterium sp. JUb7]MCS3530104.1 DNA uptake protein ComE-like DNA-binding protein [Chryseobacterium sp. JUb7]
MKSLYIIAFIALSINLYAQESKKASEAEDQAQVVKLAKEREIQMAKTSQENAPKKQASNILASEQGLEVKKQESKVQAKADNSGKLLPNTSSLEEIKASIPNRQASTHTAHSRNTNNVRGLPNTATLEEIKKTIPKN